VLYDATLLKKDFLGMSLLGENKESLSRSWVLRIFIPITSIMLATLILMAAVFSSLFTNVAQTLIVDDFLASLKMVSTYYRQMRFTTVPIIDDLSDAPEIRNYLLQNLPRDQASIGVYAKMDSTVARNSYIHSIYLYNREYGFYSSLNGLESPQQLSDSTLLAFLEQQPRNMRLYQRQSVFINKTIPLSLPKEKDTPTNLYTICNNTYDENGVLSSGIIMNLSETMARNMLASDDTDTLKNFYMIDEDYYIISHPDPSLFGKRAISQPLLGQITLFEETKGSKVIRDKTNEQYLACWYDVKEMNWRLIYILPMSYIQEPLIRLRWNLVFVLLGLSAIASLLLVWESKRVNNQLTRENRFVDFLKGNAGAEIVPMYAGRSFFIALLHRQSCNPATPLLVRQRFFDLVSEHLHIDTKGSFLLPIEHDLYVYITLSPQKNLVSQLRKLRISVYDDVFEHLSVFYSEETIDLDELPQCYDCMRKNLLSQILEEVGFVRPVAHNQNKEVNFFLAETADIGKALMQKSTDLYEKAVHTMISNLQIQEDYDLFCSMKHYLSYSIAGLIGDVFKATEHITIQEWKHSVLDSRNYDELSTSLLKISEILEEYRQQFSRRHTIELVQQIKQLVKESLSDVNLSSNLIADKIGLSLGYTRNLFKSEEGISLNEYIGVKRIEEACTLLVSTKQSINMIREALGFSNTSYFCTYFKKIKGLSPSEFRRKERM
jgi:AraC-like DNA-binding protein